jgi:hypothetical protein
MASQSNGRSADGGSKKCGAKTRNGGGCKAAAGQGTDHVGYGRCKLHGGCTPSHVRKAKEQVAAEAVANYGLPREIEPHAALLEELHRTAGVVAWLGDVVGELDTPEGKGPLIEKTVFGEQASVWVKLHRDERKHFLDVAKTCVAAGIEERRVRIAEEQGRLLAAAVTGILEDLGVADNPGVPAIVRRHLSLVAA